MTLLSNDAFLLALKSLFDVAQTKGSVFLTQKYYSGHTNKVGDGLVSQPCMIYIATDGKKKGKKSTSRKISTRVPILDTVRFHTSFMNVVKGNMTSLKKIEKTPDAKKASAAKKGVEGVGVVLAAAAQKGSAR
jgi:hypothetical protein